MKVWFVEYQPHDIKGAINEFIGVFTTREKASHGVSVDYQNWVNVKDFTISKTESDILDVYEKGVLIGRYLIYEVTVDPHDNRVDQG